MTKMHYTGYNDEDPQFLIETDVEEENNSNHLLPEKRLLTAVLERSLLDLTHADEKIKKDAYLWLVEESNQEDPEFTSLDGICQQLNLNSEEIRNKALKLVH